MAKKTAKVVKRGRGRPEIGGIRIMARLDDETAAAFKTYRKSEPKVRSVAAVANTLIRKGLGLVT